MNEKHYVSLEAAKKLKELGYNERSSGMIDDSNYLHENVYRTNDELETDMHSCPSLLEAMDWLEERNVRIELLYSDDYHLWYSTIKHPRITIIDMGYYTDRNECMKEAIKKGVELL